ncbi:DUF885 domain-containing protein [Pseudoalteromonas byunsanensis]|uniref:DUF885 domain-containing protein n=1 Tax=Pseudoalteromonas byunsanensis TaxID=327939 RepID=A0A1S1NBK9_9GAMM|nr:DUF885 domain-containing protein [Pseudoalteromonas byunsanensis]OHU97517.1 hypothetical protein BIW53_01770 [Pseudoalteromonas byunsanensis]
MIKNFALLLSTSLLSALLVGCQLTPKSSDAEFTKLAQEVELYRKQVQPYKNQSLDVAYYLPNLSADALAEQYQRRSEFLSRLDQIPESQLNVENQINFTILRSQIQNKVDEYRFKKHYMPLTSEGGFHSYVAIQAVGSNDFSQASGFELYLSRLSQIPRYFQQNMDWMRKGIETGRVLPKVVLQGYESSISGFIFEDVTQSVFYRPFKTNSARLSEAQFAALQTRAKTVLKEKVMPAYQSYLKFFTEQYLPSARESIAIKDVPEGQAIYENRVAHYTTTDMTVEQIHQLGLQEVARIRSEMEAIIEEVGFKGTFAEFLQFLRTDPQFYATTAEQLIKEAAYISKRIDAQLPKLFHTLPRRPYGVVPVPESIAPKYTTGRYYPANNDLEAGYYWVNTYALDKRPLYVLEALTLHEAVPGHHLQIALNGEMDHLPAYRRNEYISAFGEGWGLYSEYLGLEVGFYQDPYSNFGRLTYEMWRAVRLVVDTGMHMYGWSREKAMNFMRDNTALSLHNVKTETDRYISWPGQALSYKIGELTIKRLRADAEQKLGEHFDIREFHYQVLRHGSIPLYVLEEQINQYIERTLAQLGANT